MLDNEKQPLTQEKDFRLDVLYSVKLTAQADAFAPGVLEDHPLDCQAIDGGAVAPVSYSRFSASCIEISWDIALARE